VHYACSRFKVQSSKFSFPLKIRDQVEWRFEEGEIRGRKLAPAREKVRLVRPVKFKDRLIAPQNLEIDMKQLDKDLRREV